ncbi:MAG TPA: hypothetical protein RMH99_03295 [Sandaracinaceae bacterium LLY-WYZ-13_1]|nr:hypothetical protein [Sandaracinaceae bacterium LLY-WYZ-13_1]
MSGVSYAVRACGDGTHATVPVRVVFAGASGRVARADVHGVAPSVRSCIARAVRAARAPPFRQRTFRVDFPFRL